MQKRNFSAKSSGFRGSNRFRIYSYSNTTQKRTNEKLGQESTFTVNGCLCKIVWNSSGIILQSTLFISKLKGPSETLRDILSMLRHIRVAKLRKIPIEQLNFTNEHVI